MRSLSTPASVTQNIHFAVCKQGSRLRSGTTIRDLDTGANSDLVGYSPGEQRDGPAPAGVFDCSASALVSVVVTPVSSPPVSVCLTDSQSLRARPSRVSGYSTVLPSSVPGRVTRTCSTFGEV